METRVLAAFEVLAMMMLDTHIYIYTQMYIRSMGVTGICELKVGGYAV